MSGACADCGGPILGTRGTTGRCRKCACRYANTGRVAWNRGELVAVPCEVCGKVRHVWPSVAKKGPRACSQDCMNVLRRRVHGDAHPLTRPKALVICRNCGQMIETKRCLADVKRFCSRACHGTYQAAHMPRVSAIEEAVAVELDRRGISYERQVRLQRFVADFRVGDTLVEVDGTYWHKLPRVVARDARKEVVFAAMGLALIRVPESDIRRGDFSGLDVLSA